jgi:hypothetical protein
MLQYNAVNQTLTQASDIISFQTENNNSHANQKSKLTNALGMKVTIPPKDLWERALKRREEASASLSQQKNIVMETTMVTDDHQEEKKNEMMMQSSISSLKEIQRSLSDAKAMPDVSSSSMVSDASTTTSVEVGTSKRKASPRKKKVPSS